MRSTLLDRSDEVLSGLPRFSRNISPHAFRHSSNTLFFRQTYSRYVQLSKRRILGKQADVQRG
jgi:hypothetical protein